MYSKIAITASVLAAASSVSALGSTIIKNQCSSNVYVWTVSNQPGQMQTIAPGATLTEGYQINPDGGGISMKLATEPDLSGSITQWEYTVAGMLWYDISNINGFPFMASGLTLTPSISSCRTLVCPAGVELCSAAYNQPDDNEATAACDASTDSVLTLCSGQEGTTPAPSSAAASVPASTQAPAPTQAPASTKEPAPTTAAAPKTTEAPAANIFVAPDVVFTTFVTEVVTVWAKRSAAPEPTNVAAPEIKAKRASHRHHFNRRAQDSN